MILKAAIDDYLARPLDSHLWVKRLTHKQLDGALAELRPVPRLKVELRLHQKACFLLGLSYPKFLFFLDMGCVDAETEYLTPLGWKPIGKYSGGLVGQYDPETRRVTFVEPLRYIKAPCSEMIHFKSARGLDQMLSREHNMLVTAGGLKSSGQGFRCLWKHTPVAPLPEYKSKSQQDPWFYRVSADEMFEIRGQRHVSIETTFRSTGPGIAFTDAQIRVQVAVHADGYLYSKSKCTVSVKKERKKLRMRKLLKEAFISYKERDGRNGYTSFSFAPPKMTKIYGSDWWACSEGQKKIIADECVHWDGSLGRSGGTSFFSRSRSCAEFIQFCFVSTGRRAFLNVNVKPARDGSGKHDYVVHAVGTGRSTNLINLMGGTLTSPLDGYKYCFEVPTSHLVLRRNGNVFVTGNTGKTLLSLALLSYWFQVGLLRRAIIFVTSDKAFSTWEDQIKRFGITLPVIALEGSSKQKWVQLEAFGDGLVLLPYPGAVAMACTTTIKKGKKRWALDKKLAAKLSRWADGIVLDESTRVGNHQSLTYKLVGRLKEEAEVRYALSGRPFGRDPKMLWPQHMLIDDGETLGETLGIFRAAYYDEKDSKHHKHAKDYTFRALMKPKLSKMIQHRSITYSSEECLDLPGVVRDRVVVNLPQETGAYFKRLVEQLIEAKGNFREVKNVFLRMRQLSSGFVGIKDDETGERASIEFDENPKMDRLLDKIDELPYERKAIIFYDFTISGRKIVQRLQEELDLDPIWLWSGTKDSRKELGRFAKDPNCIVAVINNRLGSMSLDGLQYVANYDFFFESPVSVIDREQAEKRLHRDGQKRTVFRYDMITRKTVDERILAFHKEGRDLFAELMKNPARALF